jgi:hypothetical protein
VTTRAELPSNGLERYTEERFVFHRPFTLGREPEVYPAGVYQVETKKLPAEAGGHTAWVRASNVLVIPTPTGSYCREVRGSELDQAMLRDTEQRGTTELSENPDRGSADSTRCCHE